MADRGGRARGSRGGGRGGGDGARGGRGGRGDSGQGRGRGGYQGEGRGGGDGGQSRGRGGYQGESRGRERGGYQGEGRGGGYGGRGRGGRGDRGGRGAFSAGGRGGAPPGERHDLPPTFPEPSQAITRLEDDFFSVERKMARKAIQDGALALPERPSFGTQGKLVKLWANSFTVDVKSKNDLWACNIEVQKRPRQPSPSDTRKTEKELESQPGSGGATRAVRGPELAAVIAEAVRQIQLSNPKIAIASEFKAKLVATQKIVLPNDSVEVTLDRVTYNVSLVGGQSIAFGPMMRYLQDMRDEDMRCPKFEEVVDALNVVLGHTARNDATVSAIGSNRFFNTSVVADPHERHDLFYGMLGICRGYFQSLRLSTGRLLLNTNATYGVFRLEGELSEYFTKAGIDRRRPDRTFKAMAMLLNRARVECRFRNDAQEECTQRKTIMGIVYGDKVTGEDVRIKSDGHIPGPGQVQFHNGTEFISVMDHYRIRYGVNLNPNWPLLYTGTARNPKFTPAEFCKVLSTALKTKLNDTDSEAMITFACRRPGDNYHFITARAPALLCHDSLLLDRFGLNVDGKLVTVHGRELPPPTIKYGSDNKVQPKFGAWNMVQKKFATTPHDNVHWGYMAMLHQDRAPGHEIERVSARFREHVTNGCGIPMGNPLPGRCHPDSGESQIREAFKSQLGVPLPRIVLVFLPDKDTDRYARVKRVADVELGIHTVCMNWPKASKCQAPYFGNVALKWNLKLGGINHRLYDRVGLIQSGKTMLVGYDVTHPTGAPEPKKKPGGKKGSDEPESEMPSIVGLVASINKDVNQWPAAAWVHTSRKEVCKDDQLRDAFGSRLDLWKQHNRALPENIIIYRDGVSEGQFQQVLEFELPKIRAACEKRYPPNKRPSLAIIVSVKRHHTRFYPAEQDKSSRSGNIRPGTVVDRGVTQSRYWDFYLAAHDCLQGTARPAHYTVLLDEIFRNRRGGRPTEDLETITHDLCYMFGRATRAVSICPPAYYADIVCERIRVHRGALPEGGRGQWEVHQNLRNSMYYV